MRLLAPDRIPRDFPLLDEIEADLRSIYRLVGTAQSPEARFWNGVMFHPGVSAPSGAVVHEAEFEVYLVDADTAEEIPDSSTGPFALEFTNVPDGRPDVELRWMPAVTWPAEATNWIVEYADALNATVWTPLTTPPTSVEGRSAALVDTAPEGLYFRMRRVP